MTGAKLFSGANQALCYAKHRPEYPKDLYSNILDIAGGATSLAVDIACGSGQATTALAGSQLQDTYVAAYLAPLAADLNRSFKLCG